MIDVPKKTRGEPRGMQSGSDSGGVLPSIGPVLKRNKFGAIKCVVDGLTFDSRREAKFYGDLKIRERAGEIQKLECHPQFELKIDGFLICKYKPDFQFFEVSQHRSRVVDVKSPPTAKKRDFVLTRKLFEAIYKRELEVWF